MLSQTDRKVLEIFSKKLLVTKEELAMQLSREKQDGIDTVIQHLKSMDYIDKVESLGNCFVITQTGIRALKELK